MVAALTVARHGPASSSAARKIAARSSKRQRPPAGCRCEAASIAAATSTSVALPYRPSTWWVVVRLDHVDEVAAVRHLLAAADGHGEFGPLAGDRTVR